jgi:hypothetical protein
MAVATSMAIIGGLGLAKGALIPFSALNDKKHTAELDNYKRQD